MSLLAWLISVPLVMLRLFGVLFFADTISGWAAVPAIVICVLLVLPAAPHPWRTIVALTSLAAFVCSLYFHGWPTALARLAGGSDVVLEIIEAILIVFLALRSLTRRSLSAPSPTL